MDEKLLSRLRNLCVRREYCRSDIFEKALRALDGDVAQAGSIVESLVNDKFIDEHRYACAFARDKSSIAGWGPVKISRALSLKKIPREIVSEALSEIDSAKSLEKLLSALAAKSRSLGEDPQKRLKLIRFALSRGFSWAEVESALKDLKF